MLLKVLDLPVEAASELVLPPAVSNTAVSLLRLRTVSGTSGQDALSLAERVAVHDALDVSSRRRSGCWEAILPAPIAG